MKKFIYLIAVFLIGFASCVNNQEEISKDLNSISSKPNTVGDLYKVDATNKTKEMLEAEKRWGVTFTHASVMGEPEIPISDSKTEYLESRQVCSCQPDDFWVEVRNTNGNNYWVYHWDAHYAGGSGTHFTGFIEGTGGGAGHTCYVIYFYRGYTVGYNCQEGMSTAPWRVNGNPATPCNYDEIYHYTEMWQKGQDGTKYLCTYRDDQLTWFTSQSCACE